MFLEEKKWGENTFKMESPESREFIGSSANKCLPVEISIIVSNKEQSIMFNFSF